MADRIKGITIELDGDTTKLSDAMKGVNKEIEATKLPQIKFKTGLNGFLFEKERG